MVDIDAAETVRRPATFRECLVFDHPGTSVVRQLMLAWLGSRVSMPVLMRLAQLCYIRSRSAGGLRRNLYALAATYFRRKNETLNHFEHGADPHIAPGVVFHHSGVCITSDTVIEAGVHVYRNVTFGGKNGRAPHIREGAKIASHSIVLGGVVVGYRAIVAPGAVVVTDVPDRMIAAGVPAKLIGRVTDTNYEF